MAGSQAAVAAGAVAWVLSCACATRSALPDPDAASVVQVPVPIVSQATSYSCGAAAVMATLLYFGLFDGPELDLHARLGVTPEQGTHPDRMVAVFREHSLAVEKRTGLGLADIERALANGAVVVMAIQAWPEDAHAGRRVWEATWDDGHYVVAVGLDRRNLYVMDPSVRGSYGFIPRDELHRRWHDYEIEGGRRVEYHNLGIMVRGQRRLVRYPAAPIPIE